jgi:hypothetical protein
MILRQFLIQNTDVDLLSNGNVSIVFSIATENTNTFGIDCLILEVSKLISIWHSFTNIEWTVYWFDFSYNIKCIMYGNINIFDTVIFSYVHYHQYHRRSHWDLTDFSYFPLKKNPKGAGNDLNKSKMEVISFSNKNLPWI